MGVGVGVVVGVGVMEGVTGGVGVGATVGVGVAVGVSLLSRSSRVLSLVSMSKLVSVSGLVGSVVVPGNTEPSFDMRFVLEMLLLTVSVLVLIMGTMSAPSSSSFKLARVFCGSAT